MTVRADVDMLYELVEAAEYPDRLATGFMFTEGPIWSKHDSCLYFHDLAGDARFRWSPGDGVEEVLRPSRMGNGMTYDADASLIVCEHTTSSVVRERKGGPRETIASHYNGKSLNSPNDVVVNGRGIIYFTDPTYGRMEYYGIERELELDIRGVYRINSSGETELLVNDFTEPNGLCFAPSEARLYVNDTEEGCVRVFDVDANGDLGDSRMFADGLRTDNLADGCPDGMKCDQRGNVWVTGPGGVWVFREDGVKLGMIEFPEQVANLNWGGQHWSDLYLTASTSIFRLTTKVSGNLVSFMN